MDSGGLARRERWIARGCSHARVSTSFFGRSGEKRGEESMNLRLTVSVTVGCALVLCAGMAGAQQAPSSPPQPEVMMQAGPEGDFVPPPFGEGMELLGFGGVHGGKIVTGAPFSAVAVSETAQKMGKPFAKMGGAMRDAMRNKRSAREQQEIANGNLQEEDLGTQTIAGVTAQGTRLTRTIPAGQIGNEKPITIVHERWYSNDLQMVVMSKRSDPWSGETTYTLTNINRTEPDASLFTVPSAYTVTQGHRGIPRRGRNQAPAEQ